MFSNLNDYQIDNQILNLELLVSLIKDNQIQDLVKTKEKRETIKCLKEDLRSANFPNYRTIWQRPDGTTYIKETRWLPDLRLKEGRDSYKRYKFPDDYIGYLNSFDHKIIGFDMQGSLACVDFPFDHNGIQLLDYLNDNYYSIYNEKIDLSTID